jgi:hypothetical protein
MVHMIMILADPSDAARAIMRPGRPAVRPLVMVVPARVPAAVWVGTSRLGEIPADNLSYGVKDTVVCFRGGKAPTRRNLGAASLI